MAVLDDQKTHAKRDENDRLLRLFQDDIDYEGEYFDGFRNEEIDNDSGSGSGTDIAVHSDDHNAESEQLCDWTE